jgi:hypothetical protein
VTKNANIDVRHPGAESNPLMHGYGGIALVLGTIGGIGCGPLWSRFCGSG